MSAVTNAPETKAVTGFPVNLSNARRNESPANAFSPSVSNTMPSKNNPNPPSNEIITPSDYSTSPQTQAVWNFLSACSCKKKAPQMRGLQDLHDAGRLSAAAEQGEESGNPCLNK